MLKLDPVLERMDHAADVAQEAVRDTRKAADCLYRMGEEMRDELQKGIEAAMEEIQRLTEDIKDKVSKLTEVAAAALSNMGGASAPCQAPGMVRATRGCCFYLFIYLFKSPAICIGPV